MEIHPEELLSDWPRLHAHYNESTITLVLNKLRPWTAGLAGVEVHASLEFFEGGHHMLVEQGGPGFQVCPTANCHSCDEGIRGKHFCENSETLLAPWASA